MNKFEMFKKHKIDNPQAIKGGSYPTVNADKTKGDTFYYDNENLKTCNDAARNNTGCGDIVWAKNGPNQSPIFTNATIIIS